MKTHVGDSVVVTTSWDDGDPLDLRLAEMLATAGIAATFYVSIHRGDRPVMTPTQLHELQCLGVEIGSHTVNHIDVARTPTPELRRELSESKDQLEQTLQTSVTSFCYPGGSFSDRAAALVAESGYEIGRTTVGFRTSTRFDPYRMPVTFQVFPHNRGGHIRHALKERNATGLTAWLLRMRGEVGLPLLTARLLDRLRSQGGVLHLWGHSWELEEEGLWDLLRTLVEEVASHDDVRYMTNGELGRFMSFDGIEPP